MWTKQVNNFFILTFVVFPLILYIFINDCFLAGWYNGNKLEILHLKSVYFYEILLFFWKGRVKRRRKNEREKEPARKIYSLMHSPLCFEMARFQSWIILDLSDGFRNPSIEPSSAAFPSAVAGNWVLTGAARTWTSILMGPQFWKRWLYPLYHSARPKKSIYSEKDKVSVELMCSAVVGRGCEVTRLTLSFA